MSKPQYGISGPQPLESYIRSDDSHERFLVTGESSVPVRSLSHTQIALAAFDARFHNRALPVSETPVSKQQQSTKKAELLDAFNPTAEHETIDAKHVPAYHSGPASPMHPAQPSLAKTHRTGEGGMAFDMVVYSIIRAHFGDDDSFAERLIEVLKNDVRSGRGLLGLETRGKREAATGNNTNTNAKRASSQNQQTVSDSKTPSGNAKSSLSDNRAPKKRRVQQDDPDEPDEPDEPDDSGAKEDWPAGFFPCPYGLAYGKILPIKWLGPCRLPSAQFARHNWWTHLKAYHTSYTRKQNIPPAYIMSDTQWSKVCEHKKHAGKDHPKLGSNQWSDENKTIYLDVWRIIFPKEYFPDLAEPKNPLRTWMPRELEALEIVNLLFAAIRCVDAGRAKEVGPAYFGHEYQPSEHDVRRNIAVSFALAIKLWNQFDQEKAEHLRSIEQERIRSAVEHHVAGKDLSIALIDLPGEPLPSNTAQKPLSGESSTTQNQAPKSKRLQGVVSGIELLIQFLRVHQLDQNSQIKVSSGSYNYVCENDAESAVDFLRLLRDNENTQPEQQVCIEMLSNTHGSQQGFPTAAPAPASPPISQDPHSMTMPAMNPEQGLPSASMMEYDFNPGFDADFNPSIDWPENWLENWTEGLGVELGNHGPPPSR